VQADAHEGQAVVQIGDVGQLAPDPIQRLGDNDVEAATLGVDQHLLEGVAETAAAALGPVGVAHARHLERHVQPSVPDRHGVLLFPGTPEA
jgi:hypothetical protein